MLYLMGLLACRGSDPLPTIQFVDIAPSAGVEFTYFSDAQGRYHYVETFGAGAAFFDANGDGQLDLYLVNGASIDAPSKTPKTHNSLYINRGNDRFELLPPETGAGDTGYGMGVSAADYDGDGDTDLYVTNWGPNALYRNDGGRFIEVTQQSGVGDPRWGTSTAFLDFDRDGDLDLFVVNYVEYDPAHPVHCQRSGIRTYCDPDAFAPQGDVLYRNDGGRFVDVTQQSGASLVGRGLGVATSDYDGDGDTDIYVANDGTMNFLYRNDGGHFSEIGLQSGTRFNAHGRAEAGMGVDWADVDNDGDTDLYVTNFSGETNTLYRNSGGYFSDATQPFGLGSPTYLPLGFGTHFLDYDNDGFLDIFTANGHVLDHISAFDSTQSYAQSNQLLRSEDGARFTDVSDRLGADFMQAHVGRGSARGDYDNDGDIDLLLSVQRAPARLLRNDGANAHNWLTIELVGRIHPDALGTRVAVTAGGQRQLRERQSGGSYLSSSDPRLHFGLGKATKARVEITWSSGQYRLIEAVPANQILRIIEGTP